MDEISSLKITIQKLKITNKKLDEYVERAKLINDSLTSYRKDDRVRGLLLKKVFGDKLDE